MVVNAIVLKSSKPAVLPAMPRHCGMFRKKKSADVCYLRGEFSTASILKHKEISCDRFL